MRHLWQVARATMQNLEDLEGLTGTRKVETKAQAIITRTAEGRAAATGAPRILSKEEDLLRSLQQVVHVVVLAVDMESAGQITHQVVRHMARLVQVEEARTILKAVLAISSSMVAGNNICHVVMTRPSSWSIFYL